MSLNFPFFNDLIKTPRPEWSKVVLKHGLTISDITKVNELRVTGQIQEAWFLHLYLESLSYGLKNIESLFNKYEIPESERMGLIERLECRWNVGKRNYTGD